MKISQTRTNETMRYYQRKSLLVEPDNPTTGYRHNSSTAIARIRFIKRAQQSGFLLNSF
ncbi:MAG: MerR family transcriptional regulator [Methylococcales bacterium]